MCPFFCFRGGAFHCRTTLTVVIFITVTSWVVQWELQDNVRGEIRSHASQSGFNELFLEETLSVQ